MDAQGLSDHIGKLPAELKVWFDGPAALPRLLAASSMRRISEALRRLSSPYGSGLPGHSQGEAQHEWQHAVSTLIKWYSLYGHDEAGPAPRQEPTGRSGRPNSTRRARAPQSRKLGKRDYDSAVDLSRAWFALDPIRVGLATGDIELLRAKGQHAWVKNMRRADIETLDIVLAQVTAFDPPNPTPESAMVDEWLLANARAGATGAILNEVSPNILRIAWRDAENLLKAQGLSLPETTDLGGITVADARTCYAFLIMQLRLNEFAILNLEGPDALIWGIRPDNLARVLSSRVGEAAQHFIHLLAYRKGRSPISAPLIPHHEMLLIPAEIVSPVAFERTLLRAASAEPSTAGLLGNILGRRASRWAERFSSIPGCRVATELSVKDSAGRHLGDLDLVAWDPAGRVMLIVETKWPVDAATLAEGFKVDAAIDKGRAQLAQLRTHIEGGSGMVAWPRGWLGVDDADVSWWVGTAQQLDSRRIVDDNGIGATSLRLVEQLLPAKDLRDLVVRLTCLPLPRPGVDFKLERMTAQAGDLTIHFKALGLVGPPPQPSASQRTQHGWT